MQCSFGLECSADNLPPPLHLCPPFRTLSDPVVISKYIPRRYYRWGGYSVIYKKLSRWMTWIYFWIQRFSTNIHFKIINNQLSSTIIFLLFLDLHLISRHKATHGHLILFSLHQVYFLTDPRPSVDEPLKWKKGALFYSWWICAFIWNIHLYDPLWCDAMLLPNWIGFFCSSYLDIWSV